MPKPRIDATNADSIRLDKWLWYTRLVKSRTLAAGLVVAGKVRVNRIRVDKASHALRVGDVVTAVVHLRVRVLKVQALGIRRGPPAEARALYEDLSEPIAARGTPGYIPPGPGRPSKRERREITALKRGSEQ